VTLKLYNSAGEEVWDFGSVLHLFALPSSIVPLQAVASPDDGGKAVLLLKGPELSVEWSGIGRNGQPLEGGTYFVVAKTKDGFGIETNVTAAVTVIRSLSGVRVSVYNSAGELVWTAKSGKQGAGSLRLNKTEFVPEDDGSQGVEIRWGTGVDEAVVWNGTNAAGQQVASGTYTVQVTRQYPGKSPVTNNEQVTVLAAPKSGWLDTASVAPNPVRGGDGTVRFSAPGLPLGGHWQLRVYNLAGELIFENWSSNGVKIMVWDLWKRPASSGVYVVQFSAVGADGRGEQAVRKLAVIR